MLISLLYSVNSLFTCGINMMNVMCKTDFLENKIQVQSSLVVTSLV